MKGWSLCNMSATVYNVTNSLLFPFIYYVYFLIIIIIIIVIRINCNSNVFTTYTVPFIVGLVCALHSV